MGMAWQSMWQSLVLVYQPAVQGSCDGRTAGMFGEAAMAGTHKAQEGASGWV
jgi:hypothetical protein